MLGRGALQKDGAMGVLGNGLAARRLAAYLVASALFSAAVMLPRTAVARIHNCEHASLLPEDAQRLAQVAQHVLPPHREIMLAERCRWSDSAFAWVTTARVIGENGVAQWWMASCSRDAHNWACEPGVLHQEIEKKLDVAGVSRQVRIRFDGETNIDTVESLTSEALKIYLGTTALPYCSEGTESQELTPRDPRKSHPLPAPNEEIQITVSREKNRIWVRFGSFVPSGEEQIGIDFPVPGAQEPGTCWSAREP
jgi:hypothetical protein